MKRINYLSLIALGAAMIFASACTEKKLNPEVENEGGYNGPMQTITISAGIVNDAQTKTYIGDEVVENVDGVEKKFRKVYWSEGDEILVQCRGKDGYIIMDFNTFQAINYKFILQSGAGTENGTFVGQIPDGATIHSAGYPYSDVFNDNIKKEQIATPGSFDPTTAFMVAGVGEDGKLEFTHRHSYIKVTTDTDYSKISIDLVISDTRTYSLNPATSGGTIAAGTYYLVVPAVTNTAFSMKFEKDGVTYTKSSTNTLTIQNGKIMNMGEIKFTELPPPPPIDLSGDGTKTANSYIVPTSMKYKFPIVKGNSTESVGEVASVEVLWETFGTDTAPAVGDLIKNVTHADGYITFDATDKKGNALIVAKDASNNILWSWHIWMTDKPQDQVYYNDAGTIMDRNLGATSATSGDVGALGLFYQWGRKDPFLGASSISYSSSSNQQNAASTLTWPKAVSSDASTGTIEYAQSHPTTFIIGNSANEDWYYTGEVSTNNTRWQSIKTIYDPCPVGYRVPDGGANGIWSKAVSSSMYFEYTWDDTNKGMNFSGKFGDASFIWYPGAGYLNCSSGKLGNVGYAGDYWSITPKNRYANILSFNYYSYVFPAEDNFYDYGRSFGLSVRCCKE